VYKAYEVTKTESGEETKFLAQFENIEDAEDFIDSFPLDRILYFSEEN